MNTAIIIAVAIAAGILLVGYLTRRRTPKPQASPLCPKCLSRPATTLSGGRKVCLICAYEEHS